MKFKRRFSVSNTATTYFLRKNPFKVPKILIKLKNELSKGNYKGFT